MTSDLKHLPRRDLERLSAYLDHELAEDEQARLEARLRAEPRLRRGLAELQGTVGLLHQLPQVEAPRNFTLTPEMVGERSRSRRYPLLQFATAFAALAFLVVVGFDAVVSNSFGGSSMARSVGMTAPMAEQASPPEEPLMQAQQEQAAESGPSVADEAGGQSTDSTRAGTATPAPSLEPESNREMEATPPAALAAPMATEGPLAFKATGVPSELTAATAANEEPNTPRTMLRLAEIILALAVIVLAAATYRRHPSGP